MKALSRLLTLIVLLLLVAQAGVLYWGYERQQALQAQVASLTGRVASLESRVQAQRKRLKTLEEQSASAMVERANEVIVGGWDAIVQSVEKEMTRARQALEQLDQKDSAAPAPDGDGSTTPQKD